MEDKDFTVIGEILETYNPLQDFEAKHVKETDEEFREWLNQ